MESSNLYSIWHSTRQILETEGLGFQSLCCQLASDVVNNGRGKNPATFHPCCWTFRKRQRTKHCHMDSVLVSHIFGNDKKQKELQGDEVKERFLEWVNKEYGITNYMPKFTLDGALLGHCKERRL